MDMMIGGNRKMVKMTKATLELDDFNNIIYNSDFKIVLGSVTNEFRFKPKSNIVLEQGLTPEIMLSITELIKQLYETKST
jgi:hypothetical protein